MHDPEDRLENYVRKIHSFIACMENRKWMLANECDRIDTVLDAAFEVEKTLLKPEAETLYLQLRSQFPGMDLKKSSETLLELCLTNQCLNDKLTLHIITRFIKHYSKQRLIHVLQCILRTRILKGNVISLYTSLSNLDKNEANNVTALAILGSWQSAKPEFLEKIVIEMLKTKTSMLLHILKSDHCLVKGVALKIVVRHIRENPKFWYVILVEPFIFDVVLLCDKHIFFLEVLEFFRMYSTEVSCIYDKDFNLKWTHSDLSFDKFIDIIRIFLEARKKVQEQVLCFLNNQILQDDNFVFWVDVKSASES